jgi:hypothetical protein
VPVLAGVGSGHGEQAAHVQRVDGDLVQRTFGTVARQVSLDPGDDMQM